MWRFSFFFAKSVHGFSSNFWQPTHISWIFSHPSYLPTWSWKCHLESRGRQPVSSRSQLLSAFFSSFLLLSVPHSLPLSLHLSYHSILRKTISPSPGNRLTFAVGYCSHLLCPKIPEHTEPYLPLETVKYQWLWSLTWVWSSWPYGPNSGLFSTYISPAARPLYEETRISGCLWMKLDCAHRKFHYFIHAHAFVFLLQLYVPS